MMIHFKAAHGIDRVNISLLSSAIVMTLSSMVCVESRYLPGIPDHSNAHTIKNAHTGQSSTVNTKHKYECKNEILCRLLVEANRNLIAKEQSKSESQFIVRHKLDTYPNSQRTNNSPLHNFKRRNCNGDVFCLVETVAEMRNIHKRKRRSENTLLSIKENSFIVAKRNPTIRSKRETCNGDIFCLISDIIENGERTLLNDIEEIIYIP